MNNQETYGEGTKVTEKIETPQQTDERLIGSADFYDQPEQSDNKVETETDKIDYKKWGKRILVATGGLAVVCGLTYHNMFNKPSEISSPNPTPTEQTNPEVEKTDLSWEMIEDAHRDGNLISDGMIEIKAPDPNVDPKTVLDQAIDKISKDPVSLALYGNFFNELTNRTTGDFLKPDEMIENGRSTEKAIQTKQYINDLMNNKVEGYEVQTVGYGQIPENAITTYTIDRNTIGGTNVEANERQGLFITIKRPDGVLENIFLQGECLNIAVEAKNTEKYVKIIKIEKDDDHDHEKENELTPKDASKDVLNNEKVADYKNEDKKEEKKKITYDDGDKKADGLQADAEAAAAAAKAKAEAEQKAKEEAAKKAKIEAEKKAKEEAEKAKEEAEKVEEKQDNEEVEAPNW